MEIKVAAGILLFKFIDKKPWVFITHPGGPFYKNKEAGFWSIPKGEVDASDNGDLLGTAIRELKEETGIDISSKTREAFLNLGDVLTTHEKRNHIWACAGDWSGLLQGDSYVTLEWPVRSGKKFTFPEIDKAGFFPIDKAKEKLHSSQTVFLDRLLELLDNEGLLKS